MLKSIYGNGTCHYAGKATSRVQLTEESVGNYYADCIKLYGRISLNDPATQCSLFVQGLKPEVRDKIGCGRFETIEDAMISAVCAEEMVKNVRKVNSLALPPPVKFKDPPSAGPPPFRCWNCHRQGHRAAECPDGE